MEETYLQFLNATLGKIYEAFSDPRPNKPDGDTAADLLKEMEEGGNDGELASNE